MTCSTTTTPMEEASSSSSSNENCDICALNKHKYKCPRCAMRTCSLVCCKKHKLDTGCSGQRDKTKFVSKEEFNELTILNDYRFLEEQARLIDSAHRDPLVSAAASTPGGSCFTQNSFYDNLRKFVYGSFGICLKYMPPESTRHKLNRTKFNRNAKTVSWSLELVFHANDDHKIQLFTKNTLFQSNQPIRQLLIKFHKCYSRLLFESNTTQTAHQKRLESNEEAEKLIRIFSDFKSNFQIKSSSAASQQENNEDTINDLHVLVQRVQKEKGGKYFVALDLDKSLNDSLRNHTIIEFPTLYVIRSRDLNGYQVRESSVESLTYSNDGDDDNDDEDRSSSKKSTAESISSRSSDPSNDLKRSRSNSEESGEEDLPASKSIRTNDPVPQSTTAKLVPDDYELEEGEELD